MTADLGDGRDDAQRALLTHGAAFHVHREDPLEQARPAPVRFEEDNVVMKIQIDAPAKALQKCDRAGLDSGSGGAVLDRLLDIILPDRAADDGMDAGGKRFGGGHPVAQGNGHRDDPLPRRYPRKHVLHEMRGHLGHAPPGTGGTKAALFATEGQEHLVRAGVTAQPHEAVGQDAALYPQGDWAVISDEC